MKGLNFTDWEALVSLPGATPDWVCLGQAFEALSALDDTPQDARYHAEGDVGTHNRMVLERTVNDSAYAQLAGPRRALAFYAALFHDIAKPPTTVHEPDGSITSRGHSRLGAKMAAEWAWRAGAPIEWRESLRRLIIAHQEPFMAMKDGAEERMRKLSHEMDLRLLALLTRSDGAGRLTNPPSLRDQALSSVEWFELAAKEENCWGQAWPTAGARETREWAKRGLSAIDPRWPQGGPGGFPIVALSGLPASGKNAFCDQFFKGWPVVSFDAEREKRGAKPGSKEADRAAHAVIESAREHLRAGRSFVWNATHLSRLARKSATELCEGYGARMHWMSLEAPLAELLRRNKNRDSSLPQAKLASMVRLWEPPETLEGDFVSFHSVNGQESAPVFRAWEALPDGSAESAIDRAWRMAADAQSLPAGTKKTLPRRPKTL